MLPAFEEEMSSQSAEKYPCLTNLEIPPNFWKICGANRPKLSRYVIEGDLKPAIFGSYSFDMVNGEFVVSRNVNNSTTEINLADIILNITTKSVVNESYRKHEGIHTVPVKKSSQTVKIRSNSININNTTKH